MRNKRIIRLIESYQKDYSINTPPKCRFYPTCSQYAIDCYKKFNFVKASLLVTRRLLRCNPFSKGGYDPAPLTREEKLENQKYELMIIEKYNEEDENN